MSPNDLRNRAGHLRRRLPPRRSTGPPQENGQRLATIDRSETEQIRINWSEYEGKPFFSIRMWKRGDDGQFWPDPKRGISIRVRELPDLAEGIAQALDLADESLQGSPQARQHNPRQSVQKNPGSTWGNFPSGNGDVFDEFGQ
jgi:hypothetical protein